MLLLSGSSLLKHTFARAVSRISPKLALKNVQRRSFSGTMVITLNIDAAYQSLFQTPYGMRDPLRSPGRERLHEPVLCLSATLLFCWVELGSRGPCQNVMVTSDIPFIGHYVLREYIFPEKIKIRGNIPVAQQCQLANHRQPDTLKPFPRHSRHAWHACCSQVGQQLETRGSRRLPSSPVPSMTRWIVEPATRTGLLVPDGG